MISASTLTHASASGHLHQHPQQLFQRPRSEPIGESQWLPKERKDSVVQSILGQNLETEVLAATDSFYDPKQLLNLGQLIFKTQWWREEGRELYPFGSSCLQFWYLCTNFKCSYWILGHAGLWGAEVGWHQQHVKNAKPCKTEMSFLKIFYRFSCRYIKNII